MMPKPLREVTDTTWCPALRGGRRHYPLMHDAGPVTMPGPDDTARRWPHVMLSRCSRAWLVPPPENDGHADRLALHCDDCERVVHEQWIEQGPRRVVA